MTVIDQALTMLGGYGPEFGPSLSNHVPMAAEALIALGREYLVEAGVAKYRKRLGERPAHVAPIRAERWQDALG